MKNKFKLIPLIINILIPLLGGYIVSYINKNSYKIYDKLQKPYLAPPNIVFSIVWVLLYILMGISAYRIYMKNQGNIDDKGAYFYYLVQLIFNFAWSFLFFTFRLYGISFIWTIILIILVIITFIKFIRMDKIAGILLIPYLIWLFYASYLNFFIWVFNEM